MQKALHQILEDVRRRDPDQSLFHQAVEEFLISLSPFLRDHEKYLERALFERLVEPERQIQFRVSWTDDANTVRVNRGFRVQMNSAIGPYKGGLRFHPSVDWGVLKFLAFEQVFKNALTTLPLGGGKGGSDFDPKGKSDNEVMRFCQAFMAELYHHIGADVDVPAGDTGVGEREIGYLYGMYKKLANRVTGAITGKGISFGGSHVRPEATGYGLIYFVEEMLKAEHRTLDGLKIAISGSGNVAQFAAEKAIGEGADVVTFSDSGGTVHNPNGFTELQWQFLMDLKNVRRGRIKELADEFGLAYEESAKPWAFPCDVALPCATENELDSEDADALIRNGCSCVAEGANMPLTLGAVEIFQSAGILYAPGKASNAGGVAVSGLEMSQNSIRRTWTDGEVDAMLHDIMIGIHHACERHGRQDGRTNYLVGANVAGFIKVADAMLAQGVV